MLRVGEELGTADVFACRRICSRLWEGKRYIHDRCGCLEKDSVSLQGLDARGHSH